jgi:hypothetical protein
MLNILGVYLGPGEQMLLSQPDNPKGFWEHRLLVDINDSILKVFNGSWDRPPQFPLGWQNAESLAELRRSTINVIQRDFREAPIWGWKDPRTCLTLPFWRTVLDQMKYVICLRNPVDVAQSLQGRDKFSHPHSHELWLRYVASGLLHTMNEQRAFIFYEDLMKDPGAALEWLAKFVGGTTTPEQPRTLPPDVVDKGLYHYDTPIEEVISDKRVPFRVKALFMALRTSIRPFSSPVLPDALDIFAKCASDPAETELAEFET